ncbi:uncharacterized protein RAG0_03552 [Rhynchosporium agropyri]|uniref:Uncharacterized protein n=1 Tax=Rhynchosporium agropyri TaxID=914238 RepID=A0A1E1K520_9HELO|nr:uncharacterized protein RAG0_03552 [Rhynchosporium agropyri]
MERRKIQNREAQRRYRDNIKRKLQLAEIQLESRRSSDAAFGVPGGLYAVTNNTENDVDKTGNTEIQTSYFECPSPTLDFGEFIVSADTKVPEISLIAFLDWCSLTSPCNIQNGLGLPSPSESVIDTPSKGCSSGSTVMHIAARKGHHTIVRLLSECGVEVSARDNAGETPLHLAAAYGHLEAIEVLLDAGAEIDAKNNRGHTPLSVAVSNGYDTSVRKLLDKGADHRARIPGKRIEGDKLEAEDTSFSNWSFERAKFK